MTIHLTKAQIQALKVELAQYGLDVRPAPKPKTIDPWAKRHAARMSKTMKAVAAYGRFKDAKGVHSYINLKARGLTPPSVNDPALINAFYTNLGGIND